MAALAAALASVLLVALTVSEPGSKPGPWAALHRPLHFPVVAPGAPCSVSGSGRINFAKYGVGKGIGPGPAYPIGFAQPGSVLQFPYPPDPNSAFAGSLWSGQKVLWFVAPRYRGPVLIRGARLDQPGRLRFQRGKVPPLEMRIQRAIGQGIARPTHGSGPPAATRIRSTAQPSVASSSFEPRWRANVAAGAGFARPGPLRFLGRSSATKSSWLARQREPDFVA